jgi:hypothetical protein
MCGLPFLNFEIINFTEKKQAPIMTKDDSNKLNEALLVSPTSDNAMTDLERADKKLGPSSSASTPRSSNKPKHGPFLTAIHALLLDSLFNILLLAVPLAICK